MRKTEDKELTLSIIIVSFNTKELLSRCLNSITNYQLPVTSYEIIVVDNGSTDGSQEFLRNFKRDLEKKKFRDIEGKKISKSLNLYNSISLKVIFNKENLGFAKAVNQGIKKSRSNYLLLLNSDVIGPPGAIGELLNFAKSRPAAGIIGGKLLNPDGTPQASVYHFPTPLGAIKEYWLGQKGAFEKYLPQGEKPRAVEAIVGAVMLISRKVVEKIGLFDERFFMYFEDLDYCRRALQAGFRVYYLPKAKFIHYHGASGERIAEATRSWLAKSSQKYHGLVNYLLITLIIKIAQLWRRFLK